MKLALFGLGLGFAVLVWYLIRLREDQRIWKGLGNVGIGKDHANLKYRYTTHEGVYVRSTVHLDEELLDLIDEASWDQIRWTQSQFPEFTKEQTPKGRHILVIDPMAINQENEPGSPALVINGQQSAGTCIGVGPDHITGQPWIVVPHQEGQNWAFLDYFHNSVRNEGEHYSENANDSNVFNVFATREDVHPHTRQRFLELTQG